MNNKNYRTDPFPGYFYGAKPHAVTNAFGRSYAYDANGNMTSRGVSGGTQTLGYDEENRLISLTGGGGPNVTFGYAEGGGRLWRESSSSGRTIWIGGIYEERGGKALCHVFAGGRRIATFEPATGSYASLNGEGVDRWAAFWHWADVAATWPLAEGRAPWSLLLFTLLCILGILTLARRDVGQASRLPVFRRSRLGPLRPRHSSAAPVRQALFPWLREKLGSILAPRRFRPTRDELRTVLRPSAWWRPSVTLTLICALVLSGAPWNIQAAVYNPVFYYYQTDHLGSSSVMTDRAGDKVDYYANTAFGREQYNDPSSAFPMSNRFTGQILDDETGLYYYGARYYDPELARFVQPDTIVPSAADPQNLNRYSYCGNNPLNVVDPTGHSGIGGFFKAVFESNLQTLTSKGTWINAGIGFAIGGPIGAGIAFGATLAMNHTATVTTYLTGDPQAGQIASLALGIALASYGIYSGVGMIGIDNTRALVTITSSTLSIGSSSAALAGEPGLAEAFGYASLGTATFGFGLATYFTEDGKWLFPEGRSQNLSDYSQAGTNGISTSEASAQAWANRAGYPIFHNPPQGPLADIMQTFWQKVLFGVGDSMANQFRAGVGQLRPGPVQLFGHSQGATTVINAAAALQLPRGSALVVTAPPSSFVAARWAAGLSGASLTYLHNYGDVAAVYAPSFNPFKFLAGFAGPFLIRQHINYPILGR